MEHRPISVYLRYHWAGAGGGISLARRIADRHADAEHGAALADVARQVAEDDSTLVAVLDAIGVRRSRLARLTALMTERIARFKPNGRLIGHTSIEPVLDSEFMISGVVGKRSLWIALRAAADERLAAWDFDELVRRADTQIEALRAFHERSARRALSADRASTAPDVA